MTLGAGDGVHSGRLLGGRYRLGARIGAGGMGEVYAAEHTEIPRNFAVKLLRSDFRDDRSIKARFRREAEAAARLHSPHIVEVIDFGYAEDDTPYLVMEWLDGADLRRVLTTEGPLPLAVAVRIIRDLCRGASVAHAAGIVHRDLKPENAFLVDGGTRAKILDFGVAKLRNHHTEATGRTLGTPAYMAPEQLRSATDVDARADVYALGVMLYELCSGALPHPGDGPHAMLTHALFEPPQPLALFCPQAPPALVAVVERALARERSERFESAEAFSDALSALQPVLGDPTGLVALAAPRVDVTGATRTLPAHDSLAAARRAASAAEPGVPDASAGQAHVAAAASKPRDEKRAVARVAALLCVLVALVLFAIRASEQRATDAERAAATSAPAQANAPRAPAFSEPTVVQAPTAVTGPAPQALVSQGAASPPPPLPSRPLPRTRTAPSAPALVRPEAAEGLEIQAGDRTIVFQRDNPFAH